MIDNKIKEIRKKAMDNLKDEDNYSKVADYLEEAIKIRDEAKEHNMDAHKDALKNFYNIHKSLIVAKKELSRESSKYHEMVDAINYDIEKNATNYAIKQAEMDRLDKDTMFYMGVTDTYIKINRYNQIDSNGNEVERIRVDRIKEKATKKFIETKIKALSKKMLPTANISHILRYYKPYNKTFQPLKPRMFGDFFNTYTPNGFLDVKVENTIDINKFVEITLPKRYPAINLLLKNIAPKQEELEYLLNWFSTILNTSKKIKTSIILKGIQRTGKGVFVTKLIEYSVHRDNCFTATNGNLSEKFNNYLEDKQFIIFDEVKGDYKNDKDLANKVKLIVSEDRMNIRSMGVDPYMIDFYANCIFLSNEDVPLPLDQSDERFTIIETRSRTLKKAINDDDIDEFIKKIEDERDEFLIQLKMCKYNRDLASSTLKNDIKNVIQDATASTSNILKTVFRNRDKNTIEDILNDAIKDIEKEYLPLKEVEVVENNELGQKIKFKKIIPFEFDNATMSRNFIKEFEFGMLSNTSLKWFSTITKIEHILKNDKKFGSFWNLILNKPIIISISIDNKKLAERFRKIDEHQDISRINFKNKMFMLTGKTAIEVIIE